MMPLSSFFPLTRCLLLLLFVFQSLRLMRDIPVLSFDLRVFFDARVVVRVFEGHD